MTEILPEVAPDAPISLTLNVMVLAVELDGEITLFLQNFTVNPPALKPEPLIVRVPPAPIEIEVAESDVIAGGRTVEVSSAVAPLIPIVGPEVAGAAG